MRMFNWGFAPRGGPGGDKTDRGDKNETVLDLVETQPSPSVVIPYDLAPFGHRPGTPRSPLVDLVSDKIED
ncbi:hypothetical protein GEV33_006365 [Tenebrio molitor]|jgi:hypothetical protein|uniref:Uncharacterized protein n=1 Tax=Tenebrio molitor TaxID=7067 RepID=A0A8J6LK15_TENMO|nr:hypothetical protein GEV33_006365 [Tenebrio molitor]